MKLWSHFEYAEGNLEVEYFITNLSLMLNILLICCNILSLAWLENKVLILVTTT